MSFYHIIVIDSTIHVKKKTPKNSNKFATAKEKSINLLWIPLHLEHSAYRCIDF